MNWLIERWNYLSEHPEVAWSGSYVYLTSVVVLAIWSILKKASTKLHEHSSHLDSQTPLGESPSKNSQDTSVSNASSRSLPWWKNILQYRFHLLVQGIIIVTILMAIAMIALSERDHPSSKRFYYLEYPRRDVTSFRGLIPDLKISYKDQVIKGQISMIEVGAWNAGDNPIHRQDILVPMSISLTSAGVKILEVQNAVGGFQGKEVTIDRSELNYDIVKVTWNVLEKDDGFVLRIYYEGHDAGVEFSSVIEGVRVSTQYPSIYFPSKRPYSEKLIFVVAVNFLYPLCCMIGLILWLRANAMKAMKVARKISILVIVVFFCGSTLAAVPYSIFRLKYVMNLPPSPPESMTPKNGLPVGIEVTQDSKR